MSTVSASQQQLPVTGIRLGATEVSGWTPRELEIETLEGKHDLLTMKVLVAEKDPARWRDSPISFSWGTRTSGIGVFNGYVAAVQKAQDNYSRRRNLAASGAISQEELSHAKDDLVSAQSALNNVQQQLASTVALVDDTLSFPNGVGLSPDGKRL